MQEPDRGEIVNRLKLIEQMVAEGRRTTQRWGWMFLLWGIGPLIGIWWESSLPQPAAAWPIVLSVCIIVNGAVIRRRRRFGEAQTPATRSLAAVWASTGVTVLLIALGAAVFGLDARSFYIALFALAAVAHCASSAILRWRPQLLAAIVWWAAGLCAFVLPGTRLRMLSAAALFLGNVVFGAWLTWREWSHNDE
ncbi:MAG TPA: hypothetical protein VGF59_14870 [Bryobacteraceae bacterium]|jgi:hypothetical protein